jgi:DNA-binding transcriptional LysR family regulator
MTRIDPQRLLRLAVLIKEGSFRKAADTLGITQPALSQSIAQLEDEVGVQLITRSARGVHPTLYGEALYGHARVIDSELARATQQIESLFAGSAGSLLIGSPTGGGMFIVAQALCKMTQSRADVSVRVIENVKVEELVGFLHDRDIDVVVCPKLPEIALRGARAIRLFRTRRILCVRKDHPEAASLSLEKLVGYPFVCPPDDMGILSDIKSIFSLNGLDLPTNTVISNSISLAKDLVLGSNAFTIVSDISIMKEKSESLAWLDLSGDISNWYYLLFRQEYVATDSVKKFVKEIVSVCTEWSIEVHADALYFQRFGKALRDGSLSKKIS